jgi:hypothetical protein
MLAPQEPSVVRIVTNDRCKENSRARVPSVILQANIGNRQQAAGSRGRYIYSTSETIVPVRGYGQTNKTEKISVALALKMTHYSEEKLNFLHEMIMCDIFCMGSRGQASRLSTAGSHGNEDESTGLG